MLNKFEEIISGNQSENQKINKIKFEIKYMENLS